MGIMDAYLRMKRAGAQQRAADPANPNLGALPDIVVGQRVMSGALAPAMPQQSGSAMMGGSTQMMPPSLMRGMMANHAMPQQGDGARLDPTSAGVMATGGMQQNPVAMQALLRLMQGNKGA